MKSIMALSSRCIVEKLSSSLPPVFSRKHTATLLGGIISTGTLANAASAGYGPPCLCKCRNIVYEKETFLAWLAVYLEGGIKAVKAIYAVETRTDRTTYL